MTFEEITHCLSPEDQKSIADMIALYQDIDRRTETFSKQTGLKCKAGCGACCENPNIETTVAEVLPLAVHIWSQGQAQSKLEEIQSKSSKGVCVFYQPDPGRGSQGRCGIYAYRPGLCRLFGFAARKDKHGQTVLVTCKVIKDGQPQSCARTQEQLQNGLQAPLLGTHAVHVSHIDHAYGQKLLPINQAISLSLEKIGFIITQGKLKQ